MSIKATITRVVFNAALNIRRKAYWVYCNPSQALRRLMCGAAVAFSLITARALLILTGAGLMGAVIFIMMNTIGFNFVPIQGEMGFGVFQRPAPKCLL